MPPVWSALTSPSSTPSASASTSPSGSPSKYYWKRRITRQRKLRHITDDELGVRPQSMPSSPDKGSGSRSQRHWFKSAEPQPLPLPGFRSVQRNNTSDGNLPSPIEGPSRVEEGASPSSHQTLGKSPDDVVRRSSESPTYRSRGSPKELNVEGVRYNFRLNVPARSAPNSGFSSPVVSPRRFSTIDLFHSSCQASSALESSPQDRVTGPSLQVLPTQISYSPDYSPLQSPISDSPCMNTRKYTGVALHSYHKSLSEAWLEGNSATVHPLPLPPGVSRPSHLTAICQHTEKSDALSPVKGQWKKGKLIGRGTYGSVYVATNCETGALCAIKEVDLIPDDPRAGECIKQLEQEIKVLRQFKHPNIVQYYGHEMIEDHFCIFLEYVHPGSLNKFVLEHCGAMTESVVRKFTRHILSGLAYLHSKKTVHRDIKGANLLVNACGVVKLADFGLAKHLKGHATDLSLKGSPHWMAPEVLQSAMLKDTNPDLAFAVDIWSLGCTVIEMLTGKPPWSDLDGVKAMFNVLNRSPQIPDKLSLEGKDFLQCCFRRKPADRPSALMLLDHPFVRNPRDQNVASCLQEFSGMKLSDKSQNPIDWTKHNKTWIRNGELLHNSVCQQSYQQVSDSGLTSRHSPCSTLEVLRCTSSPELNSSSQTSSPSNISNSSVVGAGKNSPRAFLGTPGRKTHISNSN